ncbi:MAG: 4-(cytidine 5'-diphospho)-2-C-methyl-D-erythritol kinase [Casimicrobiaceae bacterium]
MSEPRVRLHPDAASRPAEAGPTRRSGETGAGVTRLVVSAPAKVNLFLHVTGRRADGYHTLESLFVLIDWADTLTLESRDDGTIVRAQPLPGVDDRDDLAMRAAHALRNATGITRGVTIAVDKRIPIGAGLGGGSADAASILLALNRLWHLGLTRSALAEIGGHLGADVPFFVGGEAALARGIGDLLTPVSMPTLWLALAVPQVQVSTAEIFAAPNLTRAAPSAKIDVFSEGYGRNDLESVASAKFPGVASAIAVLKRASPSARMTGSGGGAFATFASEADAHAALVGVPREFATRVARTLPRHPLAAFA